MSGPAPHATSGSDQPHRRRCEGRYSWTPRAASTAAPIPSALLRVRVLRRVAATNGVVATVLARRTRGQVLGRSDLEFVAAVRAAVGTGGNVTSGGNRVCHRKASWVLLEEIARSISARTPHEREGANRLRRRTRLVVALPVVGTAAATQ